MGFRKNGMENAWNSARRTLHRKESVDSNDNYGKKKKIWGEDTQNEGRCELKTELVRAA
jgi:hypothetical protein